jgi:hypothetical protein
MREHLFGENGHDLPDTPLSENEDYDEESNKKAHRLDTALLAFFLTCSVAFNVLINPHFLLFVKLLNKNYKVPSAYVLSNRLLDSEFANAMCKIKMELAKCSGLSVTLDPWTCKAQGYPYLGKLF